VDILEIGEQTGLHRRLWLLHHQANADVAPIHPKAMPVILTTLRGARRLVARAVDKAEQLQWLLPNHALKIVARRSEGRSCFLSRIGRSRSGTITLVIASAVFTFVHSASGGLMPHFYFHVLDGSGIADDTGAVLASIEVAKIEAARLAGAVISEGISDKVWNGVPWQVVVSDSPSPTGGRALLSLTLSAREQARPYWLDYIRSLLPLRRAPRPIDAV
jgi:hypothetical protein